MRVLALAVVMAAGCRYGGTFMCDLNSDCGIGGSCQTSTHYCSFSDTKCVSGQRYDETAGPYGGVCVGEENGVDAAVFDPATCPATYTISIASSPSSRYFVRTATTSFWMHHSACKLDLAGATHLLLPDSRAELAEIAAATTGMGPTNELLVGVAQNIADASAPNTGWTRVDGNSVDPDLWLPSEPNDGDTNEANHAENVASLNRTDALMNDTVGMTATLPALCECDGKAVPASVESILAGDPNHD